VILVLRANGELSPREATKTLVTLKRRESGQAQ
jgi:hypothetical protein